MTHPLLLACPGMGNKQGVRGLSLFTTSHESMVHVQLRGIPVNEASSEKESFFYYTFHHYTMITFDLQDIQS
jgi:hypothetical protein